MRKRMGLTASLAEGGFSEKLAALRKSGGFTQSELAAELEISQRKLAKQEGDIRLRQRLLAVEKLGATEKRQVWQLIDAFIERGQLKREMESRA